MNMWKKMKNDFKFLFLINSLIFLLISGSGCGGGGGSDDNPADNNPGAVSECTLDERTCDGNGFKICEDSDSDGVTNWSAVTLCDANESCSNGECAIQCADECSAGEKECLANSSGYRVCGQNDSDSCLDWVTVNCGADEECSEGECRAVINVPGDSSTIEEAVSSAEANDIIEISAGTYSANFVITDSITIRGAGAGQTIIERKGG